MYSDIIHSYHLSFGENHSLHVHTCTVCTTPISLKIVYCTEGQSVHEYIVTAYYVSSKSHRGHQHVHNIKSKLNNKDRKRVSNTIYNPCNMFSASNVTFRLAHVTGTKYLVFHKTMNNKRFSRVLC